MLTNRGLKKQDRPRDHNNDYSIQENEQTNKKNTEATRKCKKCDDVVLALVATQGDAPAAKIHIVGYSPRNVNVNKQPIRD